MSTYTALLKTLEIVTTEDAARSVEARGLLLQMETFEFVLRLVLFEKVLHATKGLSEALQADDIDLAAAAELVEATTDVLKGYRTDSIWNEVWHDSSSIASRNYIREEVSVRQKRPPAHLNDSVRIETTGSRNHVLMKDDYCTQYYYPILDRVLAEMQSRFSNLSLSLMKSVQACSPKSSNFLDATSLQPLIEHYNIENTSLPVELLQAKSVLITKEVTTIAGAIQELLPLRVAFPKLTKLLQISLTLAVSTAQCERCFSSLKRIKTNVRSTMSEERLNNLAILCIEQEMAEELEKNMEQVVDKFANSHQNRKICLR